MTEEEIRKLFVEAATQTSAGAAELTLVSRQESDWVLLVSSRQGELAIRVAETPETSCSSLRESIKTQLQRLF